MTTLAVLFSLFVVVPSNSSTLSGRVIEIVNGDTFVVQSGSEQVTVILEGVDCPESGQPYYDEARKCLKRLLLKKNITIDVAGTDRMGYPIGRIRSVKIDPQMTLLQEGLAWPSDRNTDINYLQLMQNAKDKKLGIWSEESPTPPWVFRRQQSMARPKSS